jgi:tricorn protease-like protein
MNTQQLRIVSLDNTQSSDASVLWGNQPPLADQRMVSIARSGVGMVLVATNVVEGDSSPDIYYLPASFAALPPRPPDTITPAHPATRSSKGPTQIPPARPTPVGGNLEVVKVSRITLKDSGYNSWPSISPDGRLVVFASNSASADLEGTHIFIAPVEGGVPKDLTQSMDALAETEPEWSPDGKKIVFRSVPKNSPPAPNTIGNLYVMNADGGGKKPLVNDVFNNMRPHWSPDGKYVAFSSNRSGKWEIFVVEVASGTIYQVTRTDKTTVCTAWGS